MKTHPVTTELCLARFIACLALMPLCLAGNSLAQGGTITTIAGTPGGPGYSGDNGPAVNAQLSGPAGVALDSAGNLYIADSENAAIREVTAGIITTVNTGGVLQWPTQVAVDSSGNLFVLDIWTWTVYEISGGNATALNQSGSTTAVTGESINPYSGLAVDSSGNVYTADWGGWIDEYQPSTGNWVTIYGFSSPTSIAIDHNNNIYVVDGCNIDVIYATGTIPNVSNPSPGNIYTVAGSVGADGNPCAYRGDGGPATSAQLNSPQSVAVDSAGNVFSLEISAVRVVVNTGVIHTIAATGGTWNWWSLAARQSNLYIAAGSSNVVLEMNSAASAPYLDPTPGPTVYDSGTVWLVLMNALNKTFIVPYGPGSTSASVASALADLVSSSPDSPITAEANGAALTLTLIDPEPALVVYALTGETNNPSLFGYLNWAYPWNGYLNAGDTASAVYHYSITQSDGFDSGYDANGNVVGYIDSVNGTWSLTYDNLNRLTAGTLSQNYYGTGPYSAWYDDFGNRLQQSSGFSRNVDDSAQYDNQNHLTQWYNNTFGPFSVQYDGAGNIVDDGVYAYIYDAEGRVCAQGVHQYQYGYIEWTQFLYDAAGNRVAKGNIDWASCDTTTNGFGLTNQYILGPNGEQMTELTAWSGAPTWAHTNAFAGSTLLATYANDGMGQHFRLTDWLGTTRVQVSPAGRVETTCSSFPFGEEPGNIGYGSACGAATEQFFTGKERDPGNGGMIAGNDFFGARYYSSNVGRFLSPDWTTKANDPVPYAKLNDPQSLNLYAYVGNNPLSRTDPDGHCRLEGAELGAGCSALNEGAEMLQEHTHIGGWSTKKDTTPARFIMKGKPKDHGSWTEYHYQLTNAEGKPLTGTTIYDHDGSQNTATEYYYNQGSLKDPISTGRLPYGVATDSVGWGRLNPKDVPKDDTEQKLDIGFTVDYLGKIYPITTVMEHDNKYSDGKYANTVKIIVP